VRKKLEKEKDASKVWLIHEWFESAKEVGKGEGCQQGLADSRVV